MTNYKTDVRGTTQVESADNRRLGIEFFPDPTSPAPPRQVFDPIITGRSPLETAPTQASWYSTGDEFPEWEWIQANEAWIHEEFAGHWIAVVHDRIVAIGENEVEALEAADSLGYEDTFTYYVPTGSEPAIVAAT